MIRSVFLRTVAALLVGVLLLFVGTTPGEPYDVKDPEACFMNFTVLSDAHIEGNNFPRYQVFARAMQDVKRNQSGNAAVVFLGDSTMNGQVFENLLFHGTARRYLKNDNVLPVVGNHDIGNGQGDYQTLQNRWYAFTEAFFSRKLTQPYYYDVIDGCCFIVLGMEAQEVYEMRMTEAQFAWLEEVLKVAADSGRPAFVFSHYPTDDAVDENGNPTDRLTKMLAAYNETHDLFCFVGHTHMPMYLFWSFHTYDGFPETYLPRLTELYGDDDEPGKDTGVGLVVEVYENEVVLRARDFYRGEWKYDTADETMCEVVYPLKHPVTVS
ncbi:MAG: metallophosphoesterase [Clostridia bacterium]|nr:metallophosphoesterase [Clostridia bacterium]